MNEKRLHERAAVNLAAIYTLLDSNEHINDVTVVNIGSKGMSFFSQTKLDIGVKIKITLALTSIDQILINAEIIWCAKEQPPETNPQQYRVGVEIIDPIDPEFDKLLDFWRNPAAAFNENRDESNP